MFTIEWVGSSIIGELVIWAFIVTAKEHKSKKSILAATVISVKDLTRICVGILNAVEHLHKKLILHNAKLTTL